MPLYPHDLACLHLRSSQPASVTSTIEVGAGVKSPYDSLPNRRQTSRDFVPWRFSDADRISAWRVSSCRRPRNLVWGDWCQGESCGVVESFCHVTRLHLRPMPRPCLGALSGQAPKAALRRAGGAGSTANVQPQAIIVFAATYKGHSAQWIATTMGLSFHQHE
jgi:hypothetical protein